MAKLTSFWALCLALLATTFVFAQESVPASANLEITAEFPDNPFGLIVNGQRNKVVLDLNNKENEAYSVVSVSGRITLAEDHTKIIRNLTALRYELTIPAQTRANVPYTFYSEYTPGELGLEVFVDLQAGDKVIRVVGYSGNITVSEPESSWFDPQLLFLYAVLAAGAAGVAYIVREAYFGGKKVKVKKDDVPVERPAHRDDKGQMVLDQSWIPEHHLKNSPRQSPKIKKRPSNRK
ncbi:hypothetical protein J3Q64DRAFT_1752084 [Phycomyces blakesleeanus]|uniref:Signal sequence receptor subunit alpha n=1 Tax=Phycomyces blakesleeanus TaxID=4837 RepID=A0ABR3AVE9_PHYBL